MIIWEVRSLSTERPALESGMAEPGDIKSKAEDVVLKWIDTKRAQYGDPMTLTQGNVQIFSGSIAKFLGEDISKDDPSSPFSKYTIAELNQLLETNKQGILKTTRQEAAISKTVASLRSSLSSALMGNRLFLLRDIGQFRLFLSSMLPFYSWARDLMVKLPLYEAKIASGKDLHGTIGEIIDFLNLKGLELKTHRDNLQKEYPLMTKALGRKIARMLERQRTDAIREALHKAPGERFKYGEKAAYWEEETIKPKGVPKPRIVHRGYKRYFSSH